MIENLEIICVNYNTPDLIETLINSIRAIEGNYPIRIIDGSDKEPFKSQVADVCNKFENITLTQLGWNIHHGRGMDYAVTSSKYEWCLIIDSDNYIKQPLIDKMFNPVKAGKKIISWYEHTNRYGITKSREYHPDYPIKYFHPSLCLVNTAYYKELRNIGVTFVHHGAPSIRLMAYLHDNKLVDDVCADVWDFNNIPYSDANKYFHRQGRGTVNRFGYNLNASDYFRA